MNSRKHRHRPRKSLGQFYLRDRQTGIRIAAETPVDIPLVEIGCGDGALTEALLAQGRTVVGVEIDPGLVSRLHHRFGANPHFRLVKGSILKLDWHNLLPETAETAVVGNLPYHLATRIVFDVFHWVRSAGTPRIRELVVMMQREVAERICASEGGRDYGSLTLLTKYHSEPEYLFTVPALSFYPQPQVDGGVIRLTLHRLDQLPGVDYDSFRRVVRGCFTQRRKVLRNALRVVNGLPLGWESLKWDYNRRPEQFDFEEYISLTNQLIELNSGMVLTGI